MQPAGVADSSELPLQAVLVWGFKVPQQLRMRHIPGAPQLTCLRELPIAWRCQVLKAMAACTNSRPCAGPRPAFLLGSMLQLQKKGSHILHQEYTRRFGPLFKTYGPSGANVVVTSPELVRCRHLPFAPRCTAARYLNTPYARQRQAQTGTVLVKVLAQPAASGRRRPLWLS